MGKRVVIENQRTEEDKQAVMIKITFANGCTQVVKPNTKFFENTPNNCKCLAQDIAGNQSFTYNTIKL
jgi:protein involved in ribonucleotide reduction